MRSSILRARELGLLLGLAVALVACSSKKDDPSTEAAPTAAPTSALPRDSLAKGQLIEGQQMVFDFKLPFEFEVTARLNSTVIVYGPGKPEDVANYVRARVKDGKTTVGATSTLFENVKVPGHPERPLTIGVEADPRGGGRTRLVFEDRTPPPEPPPDKRDPASRMESVGLTPRGKLLRPDQMQ